MTFLPIVERELRVAARRPGTYRIRFLAALAVIAFGFITLASAPSSLPAHQLGKAIFAMETVIAFAFCLFTGVFLTADCLSVEKREGTLGLLFLTDLNGFDVVLGKLTATSLQSVYGLLAIFPMLGLPLLMGGVSSGEFARALLALFLTLLVSLAVGLGVSAIGRDARHTMALTLGLLVFLTGFWPALAWIQAIFSGRGLVLGKWFLPSPAGALMMAFDSCYRTGRGPGMFWTSIAILSGVCLGMLVAASLLLPRTFREDKPAPLWDAKTSVQRRLRFYGPRRSLGQRAKLERNPFYWLAARDPLARVMAWMAITFLGGLWLCFVSGAFAGPGRRNSEEAFAISFLVAFALHAIFKGIIALEASRRLSEDHHSGALGLLLATPLPPRTILRGQWLALREHFARPILAVLLVNATLFWFTVFPKNPMNMDREFRTMFRTIFLGGALLLLADFRALSWVGMLMALRAKNHARAVLATLGRVLLPPWAGIFFFVMLGVVGRGLSTATVRTIVFLWLLGGAIFSFSMAAGAERRLLNQFRALASRVKTAERKYAPASGDSPPPGSEFLL